MAFDGCGRIVAAGYDDGDAAQKPPFDAGRWAVRVYAPDGALVRELPGSALGVAAGGAYGLALGPGGTVTAAGFEQTGIPGQTRWAFRALDLPPCAR